MDFYAYTGIGYELDEDAAWGYIRDGYLPGPRTILKGRRKPPQSSLPVISVDSRRLSFFAQQTLESVMGDVRVASSSHVQRGIIPC